MPRTDAQQRGLDYEQFVADVLGGTVIPGSGNQWHSKSDVTCGGKLRVSCKSELLPRWRKVGNDLNDASAYAQGTGEIPALAIQDTGNGEQFIVMRLNDFSRAFSEGVSIPANAGMSKGEEKRNMINTPLLLRE